MNDQWIDIFKAGTHIDQHGLRKTWTRDELDEIAATYDPKLHEAPAVKGHPATDDPAFGWVEKMRRVGDVLQAKFRQISPQFVQSVEKGEYKKRSAKFSQAIVPGKWYLRHVGFLGAAEPAVKGLADIAFADGPGQEYEFDAADSAIAGMFRRIRDFFIEKFSLDDAEKILPQWQIESLESLQALDDAVLPMFASADDKSAQIARAKEYGIAVKDGGNVTKPSKFAAIADEDFADPVNYAYPVDEKHIHAALSYWGQPDNRKGYSAAEQKKITGRILAAAKKHGVEIDQEKWQFAESEIGGNDMTPEELKAELDKQKAELTAQFETEKKAIQAKETEFAAQQEKLAQENAALKRQAKLQEINAFLDGLAKPADGKIKLTPGMRDMGLAQFMAALDSETELEFAAGTKETHGAFMRRFLENLPALPLAAEFATADKAAGKPQVDDVDTLVKKAKEYHAAAEKDGRQVSYADAVMAVMKN